MCGSFCAAEYACCVCSPSTLVLEQRGASAATQCPDSTLPVHALTMNGVDDTSAAAAAACTAMCWADLRLALSARRALPLHWTELRLPPWCEGADVPAGGREHCMARTQVTACRQNGPADIGTCSLLPDHSEERT